jgi:small subunit ribosomal protein S4e
MKRHLKRLRIPKFWKVPKKYTKWAVTPRAGPHKKFESIPLMVILRDVLKIVYKGKEAKSIIKTGEVLVDGERRKDPKYPVGVMDVVVIPKLKLRYRLIPTISGLELVELDSEEANKKLCRIRGKTVVRGGKMQLNLHDGRNLLVDAKAAKKYNTGDSILIELPSQKMLEHLKFEKGALALIAKGRNIGLLGKILEIIVTKTKEPTKLICDVDGEKLEVLKDYVFVVGKDKPMIKLEK